MQDNALVIPAAVRMTVSKEIYHIFCNEMISKYLVFVIVINRFHCTITEVSV